MKATSPREFGVWFTGEMHVEKESTILVKDRRRVTTDRNTVAPGNDGVQCPQRSSSKLHPDVWESWARIFQASSINDDSPSGARRKLLYGYAAMAGCMKRIRERVPA